jgi:predicted transcriptional regulator
MNPGDKPRTLPGRKSIYELPPLELECMKVLWRLEEASVRDIREQLASLRPLAYTTVETTMDRLTRKGMVSRQKVGKAHRYTPRYARADARTQAVKTLVEHFFGGSREALQAHLEGAAVIEPVEEVAVRAPTGAPSTPRLTRKDERKSFPEPHLDTSLL